MAIKIYERNILDAESTAIAQCLNCFCTQGSGVALAIKRKWPEIEVGDNKTERGDRSKLGKIIKAHSGDKIIYGVYGQYDYGREDRKLDYEAFYKGLELIHFDMDRNDIDNIAFPYKVGCDRAGGNWNIVSMMIEEVLGKYFDVEICKL